MEKAQLIRQKALAYIVRQSSTGWELLIFQHRGLPSAGWQVPGGTIDPGKTPQAAVVREVFEESGLTQFEAVISLGDLLWQSESGRYHQRHYFQMRLAQTSPSEFSHEVSDGEYDKGRIFQYRWTDIEQLPELAVDQGQMLDVLKL